jgi:hypothetical protein
MSHFARKKAFSRTGETPFFAPIQYPRQKANAQIKVATP